MLPFLKASRLPVALITTAAYSCAPVDFNSPVSYALPRKFFSSAIVFFLGLSIRHQTKNPHLLPPAQSSLPSAPVKVILVESFYKEPIQTIRHPLSSLNSSQQLCCSSSVFVTLIAPILRLTLRSRCIPALAGPPRTPVVVFGTIHLVLVFLFPRQSISSLLRSYYVSKLFIKVPVLFTVISTPPF